MTVASPTLARVPLGGGTLLVHPPRHPVLELVLVLGLSLGQSAVYSILRLLDLLTRHVALQQQTTTLNNTVIPDRPWLDLLYQIAGVIFPVVPALLAIYLLSLSHRRPTHVIGLDLRRPRFDAALGALLALGIGVPGLGLYLLARALGLDTTIAAGNLDPSWYAIAIYVLSALGNGVLEEVIMIGYLYTRLGALTTAWPWVKRLIVIVGVSALIRGSYHLYQGFGGFIGNLIMGVIMGLVFLRWRRVTPLVIAHTLLDVAAFVGYAVLAPHVNWL